MVDVNNIHCFLSSPYIWSGEGCIYKMLGLWKRTGNTNGQICSIWNFVPFYIHSTLPSDGLSFQNGIPLIVRLSYLFLQAKISIFTASVGKLEFLSSTILNRGFFFKELMTWQKNALAVKTDKILCLWSLWEAAKPLLLTYCFLL